MAGDFENDGVAGGGCRVFADGQPMYLFSHRVYRRPMRIPLRTGHGVWSEREGIIVRLEGPDGTLGFGEIAPIPHFGTETLAEAAALCGGLEPKVAGPELDRIDARFGCVRFALAAARRASTASPRHEPVPIAALLPAGRAVRAALADKLAGGYLAVKWKVGVEDIDLELGLLDEVSAALPSYVKLRLDANGAWNRRQAARWLDRCADRDIEFVEQPLAPEDRDGLLGLAGDFPVKLALDESVASLAHARRWQGDGWGGVFVVKPALFGPLEELLEWTVASKVDVVLSSAVETAVGRAAILRFVQQHPRELGRRALGFGMGGIFGDATWDGTVTGPLLEATWNGGNPAEALWNALS